MITHYLIGKMGFSIIGDGEYSNCLREYFVDKLVTNLTGTTDFLSIVVAESENDVSIDAERFSLSGSISFNNNCFRVERDKYVYSVQDLFNHEKATRVVIAPRGRRSLIEDICSLKTLNGLVGHHSKYNRFVQSITGYNCLWYIFAISFMKSECAFVHSGMMSKNKRGIILSGTSGCGKTSTMMELLTYPDWKFMAEDFGIVSISGEMYDMQKKAAIYFSDAKWGNERIVNSLKRRSFVKRAEWNIKIALGKNPVYQFKPVELFDNDIEHCSNVDELVFLVRTPANSEIEIRKLDHSEAALRVQEASFREIKELYEILMNIRAVGGAEYDNYYPTMEQLATQYIKILEDAVSNANCYELRIPSNVKPSDSADIILSKYNGGFDYE